MNDQSPGKKRGFFEQAGPDSKKERSDSNVDRSESRADHSESHAGRTESHVDDSEAHAGRSESPKSAFHSPAHRSESPRSAFHSPADRPESPRRSFHLPEDRSPQRRSDFPVDRSDAKDLPTTRIDRSPLSHIGPDDEARMVDVSEKKETARRAVAEGWVTIGASAAAAIVESRVAKGNVLQVARLAGIGAAKRTFELIPLCHVLPLDHVQVDLTLEGERVHVIASASAFARTGVEMEALTAASVAALTVYDMLKAVEKGIEIGPIRLLEKSGGKSGDYRRG